MNLMSRCKYCRGKILWAKGYDGFMLPVDLGAADADLLITPADGGWKYSHAVNIDPLRRGGYTTGRRHVCKIPTRKRNGP